jgi:phosphatidylglycerophosphate synthase
MSPAPPGRTLFVLPAEPAADVRIAGLAPVERWRRMAAQEGYGLEVVAAQRLAARVAEATGPLVLAWDGMVVDPLTLEALLERGGTCGAWEWVVPTCAAVAAPAPLVALGPELWRAAARDEAAARLATPAALLGWLARLPEARRVEVPRADAWWARVADAGAARRAEWELLKLLRTRPGGLVARELNRRLSLPISRLLLNTPVTPNQVTLVAFLLGLVGVALIAGGGYGLAVVGAALLQLNSIIDGIDGELARMRYTTSAAGAYLDSVADETISAALFAAIGWHLARHGGWWGYLPLGVATGVISLLYAALHWHCKWRHGLGFYWWFEADKPRKQVQRQTGLWADLKKLFWKESTHLLVLLLALAAHLEVLLLVAAAGAALVAGLLFIHLVVKRARW